MESTKQRLAETKSQQSAGPTSGYKQVAQDGAASIGEFQEFLAEMHGKSPKEMLGTVANSGLFGSLVAATLAIAILLVVLTVPFYLQADEDGEAVAKSTPQKAAADGQDAAQDQPAQEAQTAAAAPAAPGPAEQPAANGSDPKKAVDALGIGETKAAQPEENPLDGLDNLLDGLD